MAQPLFDQHPLEEYFRHTGEVAEPMPGGSPDFVVEEDDSLDSDEDSPPLDLQLPSFVVRAIQIANELLQSSSCTSHENTFAERFKYDVISSSLLSSSLAAAPTSAIRRSFTPELPGKLDDGAGASDDGHISSSSRPDNRFPEVTSSPNALAPQIPVALLSLAVIVLSTGSFFIALIPLGAAIYVRYVVNADAEKHNSTAQTLEALNELISAGNVWDSAVNEAILLIESEERSIFYGPTSPQAPSSALRIALQSSLHTTQTQCDNVRQLLSALTDPASLTHLAEMYAPPSPVRHTFALPDKQRSPSSTSTTMRPFSHPSGTWRQRTSSLPSQNANKRATWNGSYAALALAGSPTSHLANRKKQNRRSDVLSLFQPLPATAGQVASFSAPVSPRPPSPLPERLEVLEEEEHADEEELESKGYFGAAALELQRKRKSAGLESFGLPPPSYTPPRSPIRASQALATHSTPPPTLLSPTIASASRLTPVHTTRHPLSLSGLHLALQGALSSKRYSCSHLLALRFSEDEDDSYWENVRSVMALLSSTFSDASSRLLDALDDAEKRRMKDEHPTPPRGNTPTPHSKESSKSGRCTSPLRQGYVPARSMAEMLSFAPMPSNMSRLAGHIDAISTALNDAREHIEECIATMRNPTIHADADGAAPPSVQDHPAFQAYDRLRKELGFALRECERGRERLLDILAPRSLAEAVDDDEASPNTPGLKHDSGSESSEKGPVSPHVHPGESGSGLGLALSFAREHEHEHEHELDDASAHLLLTASSQHLPPQGAEQVFEAESGAGAPFSRARSKLSREERLKLMKARRASGVPLASAPLADPELEERMGRERWGPGGEVVQELKDVIWKVGEKRRKMSQQVQRAELAPEAVSEEAARVDVDIPAPAPAAIATPAPGLPERETSVVISVDEGSPVEDDDDEDSHLAYLDSPSPSRAPELPSQPPSLEFGPAAMQETDDTRRTAGPDMS
ncbi:hypothetical protein C8Q76DRAFT_792656 [Earliella scabrosa]|nr:hypothetical protein C8Q76DRAFT_792656 [Earliella scabrosa]